MTRRVFDVTRSCLKKGKTNTVVDVVVNLVVIVDVDVDVDVVVDVVVTDSITFCFNDIILSALRQFSQAAGSPCQYSPEPQVP